MSKPSSKPRPSDARPARRSLVELTAVASRALGDGLPVTSQAMIAADIDRTPPRPAQPAKTQATSKPRVPEREAQSDEANAPGSTAELAVGIAKEFQARALEDFKLGMNTALDHVKDLVEPRPADDDRESSLGAAAEYRSESIELAKANLKAALDYAHAFVRARTASEFVELSSVHARKQCELILKQTSVLTSLARAVAKSDPE